MTSRRLVRNAAKCGLCQVVIESKGVHDFKHCPCGGIFVDGGLEYARRGGDALDVMIELSEHEGDDEDVGD